MTFMPAQAALVLCLSFGSKCVTVQNVIDVVKSHRAEIGVIWLREQQNITDVEARNECPDEMIEIGRDPYDERLCQTKGVPTS